LFGLALQVVKALKNWATTKSTNFLSDFWVIGWESPPLTSELTGAAGSKLFGVAGCHRVRRRMIC